MYGRGATHNQQGLSWSRPPSVPYSSSSSSLDPRKQCSSCVHKVCDIASNVPPEKGIGFICALGRNVNGRPDVQYHFFPDWKSTGLPDCREEVHWVEKVRVITTFEEHYGCDFRDDVREMALETIQRFGPGTPLESDQRMLPVYKILGKYSRSMSATDIYDRLYEKGLFTTCAQFFWDWSDAHINNNDFDRARGVLMEMERCLGQHHEEARKMRRSIDQHKINRAIANHRKNFAPAPLPFEDAHRGRCGTPDSTVSRSSSAVLRGPLSSYSSSSSSRSLSAASSYLDDVDGEPPLTPLVASCQGNIMPAPRPQPLFSCAPGIQAPWETMDPFYNQYVDPYQLQQTASSIGFPQFFSAPTHLHGYADDNKENMELHRVQEKTASQSARRDLSSMLFPPLDRR